MNPVKKMAKNLSARARARRAKMFLETFRIDENTRLLDLGSENGSNIMSILDDTNAKPENVYIADINQDSVADGAALYGFVPVVISESQPLPFPDKFFDIVFCSSVIEHVTVEKERVWTLWSGAEFRRISRKRQKEFADEIKRLGRQYFVQCPYKYFPIESHSWLPFLGWTPRRILIPLLRFTNTFWIKQTTPDWCLLSKRELMGMFDGAVLLEEKAFGLTKSIMAVSSE